MNKYDEAIKEIEYQVFRNTDNVEMKISKECYKSIVEALEEKTERENPQPLTWEELKSKYRKPVWCKKLSEWIFVASTDDEPYKQLWYFSTKGHCGTILFYNSKFYDHEPKGE